MWRLRGLLSEVPTAGKSHRRQNDCGKVAGDLAGHRHALNLMEGGIHIVTQEALIDPMIVVI